MTQRMLGWRAALLGAALVGAAAGSLAAEPARVMADPPVVNATPAAPLKLLSRGVRAYASSGSATSANDANHSTAWRSSGTPATLTYDLSGVPPANRRTLYLVWYNETTYGYDHAQMEAPGYNNLGSYSIEINTAPGGAGMPSGGWLSVETVTGNTLHSRDHIVPFPGCNWLRLVATASDGSPGNADVSLNLDVYDASGGVGDGWLFAGDSITAGAMGHSQLSVAAESYTNQIGALTGAYPPQQNAGMPGWTAEVALKYLPQWLKYFHGRYVTLAFGTNEAAGDVAPAVFRRNLASLAGAVAAAGKIPVIPTIPWSREAQHARNLPGLNGQIADLVRADRRIRPGPDLYAYFRDHPELISADGVHPTDAGYAALRAQWVAATKELYTLH